MKREANSQCAAKKRDGGGCNAAALPGSRFCYFHSPQHVSARREAQSLGGRGNRMMTLPPTTPDVQVKTCTDVVSLLSQTINQVRRGEIDPRVANAIGYLANLVLAATGHQELESRIEELESIVTRQGQSGFNAGRII